MYRIEGFGPTGEAHVPHGIPSWKTPKDGRPWSLREHDPDVHAEHKKMFREMTTAQINSARLNFMQRRFSNLKLRPVTELERKAVCESFEKRLPYLSPNHRVPAGTTVDSLLRTRSESGGKMHYGKAWMSKGDAETFEKLQRELGAIDNTIAARQLYELMHSKHPTRILFSRLGGSMAFPRPDGSKVVHVNPDFTIVDPISKVTTPLCVVLGHEIEHANLPTQFTVAFMKIKKRSFTNPEEIRVIDGYENAMLAKIGKGERSTHQSYLAALDPADGKSIGFPYVSNGKTHYVRPNGELKGKIIGADEKFVTLQHADGRVIRIETPTLLFCHFGLSQVRKMGFADPRSVLEQGYDTFSTVYKASKESQSFEHLILDPDETIIASTKLMAMHSPEAQKKIQDWKAGIGRGDILTVKLDKQGAVDLRRDNKDPDPIATLQKKFKAEKNRNIRNRVIAVLLGLSVAGAIALAIIYAVKRNEKKHAVVVRNQGTAAVPQQAQAHVARQVQQQMQQQMQPPQSPLSAQIAQANTQATAQA